MRVRRRGKERGRLDRRKWWEEEGNQEEEE